MPGIANPALRLCISSLEEQHKVLPKLRQIALFRDLLHRAVLVPYLGQQGSRIAQVVAVRLGTPADTAAMAPISNNYS
jgi:hypothetical protein